MITDKFYNDLLISNDSKTVLIVLDGLGDIATAATGIQTPLEAARTPNLDALARISAMGRILPVAHGITPGSGPAHLGLFGYDPTEYEVGRGVIEALGLDIDLGDGDIAARANFCTLNPKGIVTDRRAGRIPTEKNHEICAMLRKHIKKIGNVKVEIKSGQSHRFVVVFRGKGLEGPLSDSDPHREGEPILPVKPLTKSAKAKKTAKIINEFYKKALPLLKKSAPANGFLLRGIDQKPKLPQFSERFGMTAAAIASYPMYRGLAQLVGMTKLRTGPKIADLFQTFRGSISQFDFFFIHIKATDMAGEDGNFAQKVAVIEEFDRELPRILDRKPDALAITGDHCTPVSVKGHSWHSVPLLLHGPFSGSDKLERFTETNCNRGSLGVFASMHLMRLLQANARRLDKFGA